MRTIHLNTDNGPRPLTVYQLEKKQITIFPPRNILTAVDWHVIVSYVGESELQRDLSNRATLSMPFDDQKQPDTSNMTTFYVLVTDRKFVVAFTKQLVLIHVRYQAKGHQSKWNALFLGSENKSFHVS